MSLANKPDAIDRRGFLALSAAGAGVVAAASLSSAQAQPAIHAKPGFTAMALPPRVYDTAAAGISRRTHDEHYKLYTGYVNKATEIHAALAALGVPDPKKANASYSDIRELKVEYSFALGGMRNHELYFGHLGGAVREPSDDVAEAIRANFGSIANWRADLTATAIAARGWVWTALDHQDGSLFNYIGDAQNTYPVWNATPILGLDVYEHAYFLDFGTRRADYISAFLNVIAWDTVSANLKAARARVIA